MTDSPPPRVCTALLPDLIAPQTLFGRTAVVVDVLRASTTIVHALSAGAKAVIPCLEVEAARRRKRELLAELQTTGDTTPVRSGGERGGVAIDGFDLGNSPTEYTRDQVANSLIVFTTTNGTRALECCRDAARSTLIGCFANLSTVLDHLANQPTIAIVCAGTNGAVTREDVLFAGALATQLVREPDEADDSTRLAIDAWRTARQRALADQLAETQGGRNLIRLGKSDDLPVAAAVDSHPVLPRLEGDRLVI